MPEQNTKNDNTDNKNNILRTQLKKIIEKLTFTQKITIVVAAILSISLIIGVFFWATATDYVLLYSNLSQQDASQIVTKLQEAGIKYDIRGNGSMIYVPNKKLYDTRLSLASEGLPADPVTGYELFDNNKLGMTDFMQRLNKKRAMEGELARTISSLNGVSSARVHIVIPKRALFKEDKQETTASIVLNLKGRAGLAKKQINGIVNLVSNSIEGLTRENISILDSYGNQINETEDLSTTSGITSSQYEIKRNMENNLQKHAQTLLDKIMGYGKSVVRVNVDLNFEKVEKVLEEYDPEKQVLRSEERNESSENSGEGGNATTESSISNYEINKQVSTIVSEVGNIKRLSIAVSVDGIYEKQNDEDGKERIVYKARSSEDLSRITAIIKNTLGFQEERGDVIEVVNMQFAKENEIADLEKGLNNETIDLIRTAAKYGAIFILIVIGLLIFKSLLKSSKEFSRNIWPKLISDKISGKFITPEGEIIDSKEYLEREEKRYQKNKTAAEQEIEEGLSGVGKNVVQNQIINFIEGNSEDASSLLKSWIYENGELLDIN